MKKFLTQLNLSEEAIDLYLKGLIGSPLTFYEIRSILPNDLSQEEAKQILSELQEHNLLLESKPESSDILASYFALPPISPILNYYKNITENLPNINEQIKQLLSQTLDNIFENENPVQLDSLLEDFNFVYKDLDEQYLIQKHDIQDLIQDMKEIKNLMDLIPKIKEIFENLHQRIRAISQTQFAQLIKILKRIRKEIVNKVQKVEMRRHEEEIIDIVENVFRQNLQEMVDDFTNQLYDLIEEEFNNIIKPIDDQIKGPLEVSLNKTFNQIDELKSQYFNVIEQFKDKLEEIKEAIDQNTENLDENLETLKENISTRFNQVVLESLTNVSELNKPIRRVLKNYYEVAITPEAFSVENFWKVNSITHINEEIFQIVNNSKDTLTIIVPKLEHHLNLEMFENIDESVMVKIAAGDPHTNSQVKKYQEKSNITYKQLPNKTIIAVQGDDNHILIAVKKPDSEDLLDNCLGFGTNYQPLIKVLASAIRPIWKAAKSDQTSKSIGGASRTQSLRSQRPQLSPVGGGTSQSPSRTKGKVSREVKTQVNKPETKVEESTQQSKSQKPIEPSKTSQGEIQPQGQSQSTSQETSNQAAPQTQQPGSQSESVKQTQTDQVAQTGQFQSKISPDPTDSVAVAINNAFNKLLNNLNSMNGIQFSQQLESVADVILEQKGFSVTLHNIRKWINTYKTKKEPLSEGDKSQIFSAVESWKQRIFG